MTSAIFEILALLTVSCLIGVFFTWRYWKAKYTQLLDEVAVLKKNVANLQGNLAEEKTKNGQLEADLASLLKKQSLAEADDKKKKTPKKPEPTVDQKDEIKKFKKEIALLKEEIQEKEREMVELSKELESRKISYYKQIDGKRYKARTLLMADEAVAGQGDGRISMEDAEKIFDTISDGHAYTEVEKHTMRYLRENYNWTEGADELFRTKVRSWAAKGHELE
jgi:hypothetical protein